MTPNPRQGDDTARGRRKLCLVMRGIHWFGAGGWHPDLRMGNHVATPVGQACRQCGRTINEGDQGIIISAHGTDSDVEAHVWPGPVHLHCGGMDVPL